MTRTLNDTRIAILATHGFERSELEVPLDMLRERGAHVDIIAPEAGTIRGWKDGDWSGSFDVNKTIEEAEPGDYHALVLPGGVMNPDALRVRQDATGFIRAFFKDGKPVSAICHGPQILIDCGVLEGRTVTSYPSIKMDLKNAGARWVDAEVVTDAGLTTSRTPDDLDAFMKKTIEEILEGTHRLQATA
ncbi:MAG: type 1 glutamine amidotransferase domain-containing protein [Phycisphaerales bacterium]